MADNGLREGRSHCTSKTVRPKQTPEMLIRGKSVVLNPGKLKMGGPHLPEFPSQLIS